MSEELNQLRYKGVTGIIKRSGSALAISASCLSLVLHGVGAFIEEDNVTYPVPVAHLRVPQRRLRLSFVPPFLVLFFRRRGIFTYRQWKLSCAREFLCLHLLELNAILKISTGLDTSSVVH